jgi:uncharacterized protein with HEPN domain
MFVDDTTRIHHMLDSCENIEQYAKGMERESLDDDVLLATSLAHWIQVIDEAARLVSTELKDRQPEIPWARIQGMRHRIVHDYTEIDLDIVWEVVTARIHELIPQLQAILREIEEGAH